jgi:integrase
MAGFVTTHSTDTTKSGRERIIPLSLLAIEAFQQQRFRQGHDAAAAQAGYVESGYVFTDTLGRSYSHRALTLAFEVIREKAKIRKRLHDARHTAASHLLAAGVDVRTASTILGHANPSITLSIYSHQMAGLTEEAINKLDRRLRAAIEHGIESET